MSRFQALRERRHAQWLTQLKQQLWEVVNRQTEPAPQIICLAPERGAIGMGFQTPTSWWSPPQSRKPLGRSAVGSRGRPRCDRP